jgi:hypothetical protein
MGGWYGGQVVVINGTGAGQSARVLVPGVGVEPAATNRTWVLAQPFAATPDVGSNGSWVQIMPFRGRNIFFRDTNIETGPHQFYGHAVENFVTDVALRSVRGLMAWGQWRGWVPPPPANSSLWRVGDGAARAAFGGQMGNGMQVRARGRGGGGRAPRVGGRRALPHARDAATLSPPSPRAAQPAQHLSRRRLHRAASPHKLCLQ